VSNLESEYLEEENGQPAKPSNKAASTTAVEKKGAIETASNKRMRSANINTWTLRYNDESLESKVTLIFHWCIIVYYLIVNSIGLSDLIKKINTYTSKILKNYIKKL